MSKRPSRRGSSEPTQTKGAVQERIRQMLILERLCSRFHRVVQQLRSRPAERPPFLVNDEYDVQDLLHALLTLEYDDVRPETWTPGYAGGETRTDFLLKLEQIVMVAKWVRSDFNPQVLSEQLQTDVQRYQPRPECRTVVCFVYDPERQIANPRGVENELNHEQDGLSLRVIIAPKGV